jgi:hypothetical protein
VRRPIKKNDTLQTSRSLIGVQAELPNTDVLGIKYLALAGNNAQTGTTLIKLHHNGLAKCSSGATLQHIEVHVY